MPTEPTRTLKRITFPGTAIKDGYGLETLGTIEETETAALSSVKIETGAKGEQKATVHVFHADPMEAARQAVEVLSWTDAELLRRAGERLKAQLAQTAEMVKANKSTPEGGATK